MTNHIIIDGPDGCGKNSQADLLMQHLQNRGMNPLLVQEPCEDFPTGRLLRQLLKSGEYREAFPGLFLADRMVLQANVIKPAIDAGRPVVSVRSYLTSLVYQAEQWPVDWLWDIHKILSVKPTHVVFLDVDPEEASKRMDADNRTREIFEEIEIQKRVRQRYLELPNQSQFWDSLHPQGKCRIIPTRGNMTAGESKQGIHQEICKFIFDEVL